MKVLVSDAVLSIAKVRRGGERYYLEAVAGGGEDQRRPGQEPDGTWLGRSAGKLGLRGAVGGSDLAAVLAGADPTTGEVRNPAQDRVRVAGFDLVFAAPKSVSLCYALGDMSAAEEVRLAHEAAVAAALGYLEREAITARRGSGAQRRDIAVDGVVGAAFLHRTSRSSDPHLHSHVLVANTVEGSDGRWSAFDARGLYAHARTAGFLYQAHLRHQLSRRLGLEWEPVCKGMADVEGIDRSVIRVFSRRSAEILARLGEEGRAGAKAARIAQLTTRTGKDLDVSFESLVGEWRARAAAAGLGPGQLAAAMTGGRQEEGADRPIPTTDWIRGIVGPEGLTASASTFSRRDVIRACCSAMPNGADVPTIEALAEAVVRSGLVQPVPGRAHEPRWTTPEVVAAERALVEQALRRAGAGVGVARATALEKTLAARPQLATVQRAAVGEALVSPAGVIVATGARWDGAIDALDAAREGWQSCGLRVQAGAFSAEQAADLEAVTGIETLPLSDVLTQLEASAGTASSPDVLIVHGAGQLSTATMTTVLDGAERTGTKLVLVGEARQLHAVEGGALRRLGESLGSLALGAPRPTAPAVRAVGRGWAEVVERGDGGAVVVASSAPALRQRLVADWWTQRQAGREPVMVASSPRELDVLNVAARHELMAAGHLGESMVVGQREMAVGDRVLIGRGGRGVGVPAGTRATVVGLDAERGVLDLRTARGRAMSMSVASAVGAELRHAYATSPREARRARPEQALVLGDERAACGRQGSDCFYVVDGVGRRPDTAGCEAIGAPGSSLGHLGPRLEGLEHRLARAVAPDPTAALAQLDQERARTGARLLAAESARSAAAARLDELGAGRWWTGRRVARDEARDLRTELAYRESEVRRWEARREQLGGRRRDLEAQAAARARGLASRGPDVAHRQVLVQAVSRRGCVLARAAEASPPAYLVSELGARPARLADREAWREAAMSVESYRERWGVRDPHRALGAQGGRSASLEQRLQRDSAARQLHESRCRLRPELAVERSPEPSMGLETAPRAG